MRLDSVLNLNNLQNHIDNGTILKRNHPEFPLSILNYGKTMLSSSIWDNETYSCRGLIYNHNTMQIVARGYRKFWNFGDNNHPETLAENLPNEIPIFSEKLDGSLGIVYHYKGVPYVATRGAFDNDGGKFGSSYAQSKGILPIAGLAEQNLTLCGEIIQPENRIVVNYGDYRGMIFHGLVDNRTGLSINHQVFLDFCKKFGLEAAEDYVISLRDALAQNESNREGYIASFSNGLKIKIKFKEYMRLSRIMSHLRSREIHGLLAEGKEEWLNDLRSDPNTDPVVLSNLEKFVDALYSEYHTLYHGSRREFLRLKPELTVENITRKEQILIIQNSLFANKTLLINRLDNNLENLERNIWKSIAPKHSIFLGKIVDE